MKTCPLAALALALGCSSHDGTPIRLAIPHEEPVHAVLMAWESDHYTVTEGAELDCYIRTEVQPTLEVPSGIKATDYSPEHGLAKVVVHGDVAGTYTLTAKCGDFKCSTNVEVIR